VIAALSVLAHEVPHHMGDLVVLRQTSGNRRMALVKVSLAGAVTALGGTVGYFLVGQLQDYLPYFLAVASSSFVYVALADLIPQLQKRLSARETMAQIAWLGAGIALVTLVSGAHAHWHHRTPMWTLSPRDRVGIPGRMGSSQWNVGQAASSHQPERRHLEGHRHAGG
jgi:zinc and cadmium transporter